MIRLWNWMVLKYWERKVRKIDWEAVQCNGCGEFVGSMPGERLIDCKCERMCEKYARKLGWDYFAEEIDG